MLKVNGVDISAPITFKVDISDLDAESSRNARGELSRDRIAVKRKLDCEWGPLTSDEISPILQAVQGVFFSVEYPDPLTGTRLTKTFYVGPRTAPAYHADEKGKVLWKGLSMSFIEK